MHILDESHILLFLVQLLVLLAAARTLGAICEEFHIPALAGEMLAGVALGPTLLGRVAPGAYHALFPEDPIHGTMLETVSWLGVFFLLLSAGFHVDVRGAMKQGRAALSVGVVGVLVPIAIGAPVFWLVDAAFWGDAATRLGFSLFLAVAGSITAISVVARALADLGVAATPLGSLALSACAVNDLFGWLLFTVVVSIATAAALSPEALALQALGIVAFVLACVTLGATILGWAAARVRRTNLPQPAALMTLVVTAGLLCGVVTQWLGIHAILGFFLAGTMAGSAQGISTELRHSLTHSLHAIFVPVFFATLGVHIDFVTGMDLGLTALFFGVAVGGKFMGAWVGARLAGVSPAASTFLGVTFSPGGAMEIVVGALALELQLISQVTFVAIVFAALASSILVGPLMAWRKRVNPDEPLLQPLVAAPATGGTEAPG